LREARAEAERRLGEAGDEERERGKEGERREEDEE
jgi:hypothetical protein